MRLKWGKWGSYFTKFGNAMSGEEPSYINFIIPPYHKWKKNSKNKKLVIHVLCCMNYRFVVEFSLIKKHNIWR